ncbi:MAG: hypothetical protein A2271_03160 [Candidatus Moranbacteria bacterium RIFOXYA12_FULL_35_19]|nr:MAG: hypothetical protein A2343_02115 [Candidatus Moranbacteria bacterium RIFOXYB12_FULL_35_8]OGI32313.1 MAG: hypothetical protein A2489_03165 [Candidatus Moranbacteria bacterium RIFOXYC12_FULL_36_13]OGI36573.1 MAG: hypothetical protein A2271_03160 [Candidatus Moranbacteria bacterium RIFOXYA12_FULL_35_19]
MENIKKTTINLFREIAPIIGSRDLIDSLEKVISASKYNLVDLDFQKVEFVSRSAAHALLVMKEDFSRKTKNKKEIAFVNANEDIEKMLRIVAANRALPKKGDVKFEPEKADINSLVTCKNC